jgi:exopolysaccharide biosynthesis polyprenyl glycosylphosphotransferase
MGNPLKIEFFDKMGMALSSCVRETDVRGWYKNGEVIGIIFAEIPCIDENVKDKIFLKIHKTLSNTLGPEQVRKIEVSFHIFPEEHEDCMKSGLFDLSLYPELTRQNTSHRISFIIKRIMDVVGSIFALVILSPLFLTIGILIKLTSKGPVLFKQERLGLRGEKFTFLKFRSMYTNCEENTHKDYIKKFIREQESASLPEKKGTIEIYKLKEDPRITPFGMFLRKTSLDELPQFINVLKGEMSLVGPRPPIPYECDLYDIWHRQRVLEAKPGITGLWQIKGRSSITFDEMVRLDLQYIREWSLWLDIKILLQTPWAVLSIKGAY